MGDPATAAEPDDAGPAPEQKTADPTAGELENGGGGGGDVEPAREAEPAHENGLVENGHDAVVEKAVEEMGVAECEDVQVEEAVEAEARPRPVTVALTPQEMIETLDRKLEAAPAPAPAATSAAAPDDDPLIGDILANLEGADDPPAPLANALPPTETNTTEDLLSILQGEEEASRPSKMIKPSTKIEPFDAELERKIALEQLDELNANRRAILMNRIADEPKPERRRPKTAGKASPPEETDDKGDPANGLAFLDDWNDHDDEEVKVTENEATLAAGRSSRLIKKKVIFDPDNPDSYETHKGPSPKKRPKSPKSKAASSPSCKKKRLSEIERLLMDEGAVNMLYSVEREKNDEVPDVDVKPNGDSLVSLAKERRALINKAEIIKNAVFNVVNPVNAKATNVKLFRARKEPKSAIAPPEAPKADPRSPATSKAEPTTSESRIIRRHSSSSYSSECFSPRQSVDDPTVAEAAKKAPDNELAKRKRKIADAKKTAKKRSAKGKMAVAPVDESALVFTQLSTSSADGVTHIVLKPMGNSETLYDAKVLEELCRAIEYADRQNTSVLLLTSESGVLCGGLDLRQIVQSEREAQKTNADNLLDNLRDLIVELCNFQGVVVAGVDGSCNGLGVSLLSLTDLAIASDRSQFCISPQSRRHLPPEGSVLLKINQTVPAQLIGDMVFCGRSLNSMTALERGLIARTISPDRFAEELLQIAKDIAKYPTETLKATKNILRLNQTAAIDKAIQREAVLLSEFWCSPEGQKAIRSAYSNI